MPRVNHCQVVVIPVTEPFSEAIESPVQTIILLPAFTKGAAWITTTKVSETGQALVEVKTKVTMPVDASAGLGI